MKKFLWLIVLSLILVVGNAYATVHTVDMGNNQVTVTWDLSGATTNHPSGDPAQVNPQKYSVIVSQSDLGYGEIFESLAMNKTIFLTEPRYIYSIKVEGYDYSGNAVVYGTDLLAFGYDGDLNPQQIAEVVRNELQEDFDSIRKDDHDKQWQWRCVSNTDWFSAIEILNPTNALQEVDITIVDLTNNTSHGAIIGLDPYDDMTGVIEMFTIMVGINSETFLDNQAKNGAYIVTVKGKNINARSYLGQSDDDGKLRNLTADNSYELVSPTE